MAQEIPEGANLDDYTTLGDFYGYAAGGRIQNSPINDVIALSVKPMGAGLVHQTLKGPQTTLERGQHYTADGAAKVWHDWAPLATATPPQEYDLPLAAGYVVAFGQACDYSVAQDNLVVVHVSVARQDGTNLSGVLTLATLPAGIRPAKAVISAAAFGVYLKADTNGAITCHAPGTYDSIGGTLVFYATD